MLTAGISLVTSGALLPSVPMAGTSFSGMASIFAGAGSVAIGAVVLALGTTSFVVAYGVKGFGRVWNVTVALAVIGIVLNAISVASGNFGGIVSVIISAVILYYMYRPHIKMYFGKAASRSSIVTA